MDTSTTSIASEIGEMKTPPENMVINKASAAEEAPVVVAGDEDDDGEAGLGLREEVKKQLWLAGPLVAGALLRYVIQMISVMFVGHLGELPLAGASMANSFTTVTGFSLLETLRDAKHLHRCFLPSYSNSPN
ncbi:Os06g0494700 [Oryza sativa Japonica Group]|uniref:Os06g0494700 protein n=1 Tax=Oryza sativa subsp. japonica TaxID=39947 RepID=Q0DC21_ORYSJ|nr:Os06g0494700 [Oryza sativa Japonica Group]|eukprot:NP_001057688.2 Os06g0494700 [Oryza sativa Japonica Group]